MPKRRPGSIFGAPDRGGAPGIPGSGPATGGPQRRRLVEPPGYAITSFLTSVGLVAGFGLAPDGLLLVAAATILSVIEWRRVQALNTWLTFETPDDFRTHEGKQLLRWSAWGALMIVGLSVVAFLLAHASPTTEDGKTRLLGQDTAVLGPALLAGVGALAINYLLRRAIAKAPAPTDPVERMGGDPVDGQDSGLDGEDGPYRPENWIDSPDPELPAPYDPPAPDPEAGDDGDGFRDQDYSALHGKQLEPRSKTRPKDKRRRGDRDGS